MKLIVDANKVFSFLIKNRKDAEILTNIFFEFYAPEYLFLEIVKYKEEILIKTHRTKEEFYNLIEILRKLITIIPKDETKEHIKLAEQICPDPDDVNYFALALKMNCGIWSADKKLKEQDKIKIYTTEELINLIF